MAQNGVVSRGYQYKNGKVQKRLQFDAYLFNKGETLDTVFPRLIDVDPSAEYVILDAADTTAAIGWTFKESTILGLADGTISGLTAITPANIVNYFVPTRSGGSSSTPTPVISKVLNFPNLAGFPTPAGLVGTIYIAEDTDKMYLWDAITNQYVLASGSAQTSNPLKRNKTTGTITGSKVLIQSGTTGIEDVESTVSQAVLESSLGTTYTNALTLNQRLLAIETAQPTFDDVIVVATLPTTDQELGKLYVVTTGATKGKSFYWDGTTFNQTDKEVGAFTNQAAFPVVGEDGLIYVDKTAKKSYFWNGTAYVELSATPAVTHTLAIDTTTNLDKDVLTSTVNSITQIVDLPKLVQKYTDRVSFPAVGKEGVLYIDKLKDETYLYDLVTNTYIPQKPKAYHQITQSWDVDAFKNGVFPTFGSNSLPVSDRKQIIVGFDPSLTQQKVIKTTLRIINPIITVCNLAVKELNLAGTVIATHLTLAIPVSTVSQVIIDTTSFNVNNNNYLQFTTNCVDPNVAAELILTTTEI